MSRMGMEVLEEVEQPSRCMKGLYLFWKFCSCIFGHVTLVSLVVAYCLLGALAFVKLEKENEIKVKESIKDIRGDIKEQLWRYTDSQDVLYEKNWTKYAMERLKDFETELLKKMKKEGWDGNEDPKNLQWTFLGALFYCIIVITTIGYGHIAPRTKYGKVVTIFYAILGIPLMLLCLSNIGDIMASSFRFLYWKVCCYVCTKPPRRKRHRRATMRQSGRYSNRTASFRRSVRNSQRSADSALGESMTRSSYSDTDCRRYSMPYKHHAQEGMNQATDISSFRPSTSSRYSDIPLSSPKVKSNRLGTGTASLDRKIFVSPNEANRMPVLFNKYALDPDNEEPKSKASRDFPEDSRRPGSIYDPEEVIDSKEATSSSRVRGTRSLPRHHHLAVDPPSIRRQFSQPPPEIIEPQNPVFIEMDSLKRSTKMRRAQSYYGSRNLKREVPSPRIMSPMGFAVHRQIYVDDFDVDYDYDPEDYASPRTKPVPIWLCVFLVVSYILGGAYLFHQWEGWEYRDSAYFCFITLTTIGFGDFVPARGMDMDVSIGLCSLYLLFGIALLAMSFNLVQEEVINNVKSVAKRLGIIKENEDDEED